MLSKNNVSKKTTSREESLLQRMTRQHWDVCNFWYGFNEEQSMDRNPSQISWKYWSWIYSMISFINSLTRYIHFISLGTSRERSLRPTFYNLPSLLPCNFFEFLKCNAPCNYRGRTSHETDGKANLLRRKSEFVWSLRSCIL